MSDDKRTDEDTLKHIQFNREKKAERMVLWLRTNYNPVPKTFTPALRRLAETRSRIGACSADTWDIILKKLEER